MDYETVLMELTAIVRRHADGRDVGEGSRFIDLGFDSLGIMNLVAEIEDHFDITISLNALPELQTVAETARHIVSVIGEPMERM